MLLNAYAPIDLMPFPRVRSLSAVQFRNAPSPIASTLSGMSIDFRAVQPANELKPTDLMPFPRLTVSRAVQLWNVSLPISVTVSGIDTDMRDVFPLKRLSPNAVTFLPFIVLGMSYDVTPDGSITFSTLSSLFALAESFTHAAVDGKSSVGVFS